ncbi:MAG TPA: hypothetical protein VMW01_08430 [Williamwhitmania sp.]|nr:hypothetical protein [Williamwhitmania sp.]
MAIIFNYNLVFENFFANYFRYPYSIEEFYNYWEGDTVGFGYAGAKKLMQDPFSVKGSDLLYVPIYSRASKESEGFLLISAGIDGKIDNQIKDTIYFESVKTLRLYNYLAPATTLTYRKYNLHFSFKDYLLGNSDLMVEYADGIAIFLNNASHRVYTPTQLMNKLYPRGFTRLDCSVEGKVKSVNDSTVAITDDTCSVVCTMYKGRPFKANKNELVRIAGCFRNKLDPKTKTIYLDHCIAVDR